MEGGREEGGGGMEGSDAGERELGEWERGEGEGKGEGEEEVRVRGRGRERERERN